MFTRTIMLNLLMKWLLGLDLSQLDLKLFVNDKIVCLPPSITPNVTKKKLKWTFKNCQANKFLKPLLQFVSIFKFVQPCLLLYLLCLLYILSMFWAVNFMFRSVWLQFSLLACSRLRDSRAGGTEKARTRKKREETGERGAASFSLFPAPPPFSRALHFRVFPTLSRLLHYLRAWNRRLSLFEFWYISWPCSFK